jgi:16S rRNA (cytidine1402-2'-O)-methyltransferase
MALMASGFNGQRFAFHGYLSVDNQQRVKELKALELSAQKGETQIFMDTPYRNNQLFQAILDNLSPNTKLCIACNLTAQNEYIRSKTIAEWKNTRNKPELHKLPTIFVLK